VKPKSAKDRALHKPIKTKKKIVSRLRRRAINRRNGGIDSNSDEKNGKRKACGRLLPITKVFSLFKIWCGYVAGLLLLWFMQPKHTGLSFYSTFPETK
jgi:hypothetical protein